ncbi:LPP20 family lipoprotein [Candidatus Sulfurimonas baltica]|uniref:LPP20 family lipoprotein n=1 Tax=Candidatus Sulfurimonas baltica TaxID=2740404 RepID=A0A7S7RMM7_9BACT|nr:LPP20 family lipoprotein [Candidatus Sulfurimonas baltica]QOY51644.1 LPP20 family lipoprotein [Candidatus Sulfurimonas baltica]
MTKIISSIALAGLLVATITGCGKKDVKPADIEFNNICKQENVQAPDWTCRPSADGAYAGVGVAQKSAAGMGHMRRVAVANGRSDLAQQISTLVKDKISLYTGTTGVAGSETVDQTTEAVTKQVAKVDLVGSKSIDTWNAPSGALYMLVTVSKQSANEQIKNNLATSFKNDQALWQQFKAKNALEGLEKEFSDN